MRWNMEINYDGPNPTDREMWSGYNILESTLMDKLREVFNTEKWDRALSINITPVGEVNG